MRRLIKIALLMALSCSISQSSAETCVLNIFGNADMNGSIDEKDIEYLKGIVGGTLNPTLLADANYDGKIDDEDIHQVERIIEDTQENLTILDGNGRAVTIRLPVERAIVEHLDNSEMMMILNRTDKVVGVDLAMSRSEMEFPQLIKKTNLPGFSPAKNPDYELALSLNPDLLLTFSNNTAEKEKNLPGVPVVFAGLYYPDLIDPENSSFTDAVHKLGYIMQAREEAGEYISWHISKINEIKSATQAISHSYRPTVLIASLPKEGDKSLYTYAKIDTLSQMVALAGGISIAEDLPAYLMSAYRVEVDPEWAIDRDPEYIVFITIVLDPPIGYDSDDITGISRALDAFKSRPEYANLTAVRNDNVYIINGNLRNDASKGLIGAAYLAKIFHPEEIDMDPEALHQEYLNRFLRLNFDLDQHGVFVYPPLRIGKGLLGGVPDRYWDAISEKA
ncbi:MAG: Periplasmic binding protein [Methanosaeta sp. PtaB.Bin039]|nr:MAG: Periplasmic binding protein [Methanosaeta sp. PtaB.Bin039]HOT07130.1 ABC transporter substrate-binding protein [Methanotrichaceae archaeon]HQF17074.1 ABC transporter substrate-binding protein [Methanotrichaceae archaeon]HQI91695.1 ABC transporter substrate-binding protein [Methanotrichaceae archaeon]HQJ29058.1 ABC transporter substrate-binding protein [Methanotrichaceae archaeon]